MHGNSERTPSLFVGKATGAGTPDLVVPADAREGGLMTTYEPAPEREPPEPETEPGQPETMPDEPGVTPPEPGTLPEEPDVTPPEPESATN